MDFDHSIVGLMSLVFLLRRDPLFEALVVFFLSHTQLARLKFLSEATPHPPTLELVK